MIEIKAMEPRDEKRQVAFFTLDGQEFSCGNVPIALTKAEDIQAYLDGRADEFKLLLLKREYPDSDHKRFLKNNMTELEAMSEWITKGHKNKIIIGYKDEEQVSPIYGYEIIEKQELRHKHPKSVKLKPLIEAATTVDEIKEIMQKML